MQKIAHGRVEVKTSSGLQGSGDVEEWEIDVLQADIPRSAFADPLTGTSASDIIKKSCVNLGRVAQVPLGRGGAKRRGMQKE